jgi:hypothetical protein
LAFISLSPLVTNIVDGILEHVSFETDKGSRQLVIKFRFTGTLVTADEAMDCPVAAKLKPSMDKSSAAVGRMWVEGTCTVSLTQIYKVVIMKINVQDPYIETIRNERFMLRGWCHGSLEPVDRPMYPWISSAESNI